MIEFSPLGPEDATPRPEPDFLDESRERLSVQAVMLMNIYFRLLERPDKFLQRVVSLWRLRTIKSSTST